MKIFKVHSAKIYLASIVCVLLFTALSDTTFTKKDSALAGRSSLSYPVAPAIFRGVIGGHEYNLTGTIDQVNDQLAALYPDLDVNAPTVNSSVISSNRGFGFSKGQMQCYHRGDWLEAEYTHIIEGVNKLTNRGGQTFLPARQCVLMWCKNGFSRGHGIWACNDTWDHFWPNTAYLVSYAYDMLRYCTRFHGGNYWHLAQFFDTDGYNVIVRGNEHRCGV